MTSRLQAVAELVPMRVAMVVWNEFRNDARVLKEAETLLAAGHDVTVFALHTPGVTSQSETLASGIRVVRTARRPFWRLIPPRRPGAASAAPSGPVPRLSLPRRAVRIAFRGWTHAVILARMVIARPGVVHAHDVNTLPTAWLAATVARARLVYDAHEISTGREGYADFRGLVGFVEKRLMPRADATITTTDARAKFFARAYGVPRPLVLQNRPRFVAEERSDRIRRELGLSEPSWPIVLYQGGLQQGRGLEHLLTAASRIADAYFVFIGGGRLAPVLEARARESGLAARVRFIPTVSLAALPSYTASADIGVQPIENTCLNHFTTDSNKLFEYMMAGLPVVATNLPEIRRIVEAHDFGRLVPSGAPDRLVEALRELIDDEKERARLGRNALRAASELHWDEQEQKLVELYRGLRTR